MNPTTQPPASERRAAGARREVAIARTRDEVAGAQAEAATADHSRRVPDADLLVVTPAAADGAPSPERTVLLTLDGDVVPETPGSTLAPAADAAEHAAVYRALPSAVAIDSDPTGGERRLTVTRTPGAPAGAPATTPRPRAGEAGAATTRAGIDTPPTTTKGRSHA